MFHHISLDKKAILELENQFQGVTLFSVAAEQAFAQKTTSLIIPEPEQPEPEQKAEQENAKDLLCQIRYKRLKTQLLKNPHYFDLTNLGKSIIEYETAYKKFISTSAKYKSKIKAPKRDKVVFKGSSIQECQQFTTNPADFVDTLVFEEEDIYSLSAHIEPPTKLNPSIEGFLDSCGIPYNEYEAQDLNIKLTEKLKGIKVKQLTICDEEFGHFDIRIPIKDMAPQVIRCVIEVINENFGTINLSREQKRKIWIPEFTAQMTGKLRGFEKLRARAAGQNTFDVLCVLHASLSDYREHPITQSNGEEYLLDAQLMDDILSTISFSASIARELDIYKGNSASINQLVTIIIQKANLVPVILPVCTPIPPGKDGSEHAFYIVLKKIPNTQQYKISIINCGYASEYEGVVDFKKNFTTQETTDYLCSAFAVEFFPLHDDGLHDSDELVTEHLKKNIYDIKAHGAFEISNRSVNQQFYENCTLHNYNFSIKHCFDLDTLKFGKFRQMTLAGFDMFIENNKKKPSVVAVGKKKGLGKEDSFPTVSLTSSPITIAMAASTIPSPTTIAAPITNMDNSNPTLHPHVADPFSSIQTTTSTTMTSSVTSPSAIASSMANTESHSPPLSPHHAVPFSSTQTTASTTTTSSAISPSAIASSMANADGHTPPSLSPHPKHHFLWGYAGHALTFCAGAAVIAAAPYLKDYLTKSLLQFRRK